MRKLFDKRYKPEHHTSRDDYDLSCPYDSEWDNKSQRVLLVIETIDGQDLAEKRLLHDRSNTVVSNLLNYSINQAKKEFGFKSKDCAFATVNFNSYKFFDQPMETWPGHRRRMAKRVNSVIEDLKPTTVIVFGDRAMQAMVHGVDFLEKKRGWVFDYNTGGPKGGGYQCKISGSLDLQPLYSSKKEDANTADDEEEGGDVFGKANLLFYVSRNILNALAGRNLYDLSHIRPNPRVVDTIAKFDKLYQKLITEEIIAVDSETRNGSVNHNAIHTLQFAFGTDKGYLLPIDHPQTPFSPKEIKYIKKKLRAFFYAKTGELPLKYLITQYGIFDLRVLRVELGIPIIFHNVWEIQAGQWCFHPDTLIETDRGRLSVKDIVSSNEDIKVWSFNFETGEKELKNITNRVERPSDEPMVEIQYEGGSIRVTASHKIWSNTKNTYIKAIDVEDGEDLEVF